MGRQRAYVHAIDFVRMATIIAVVVVHSVRFALVPSVPIWGGLIQLLFQYGRESFMVITGFVLTYQYLGRTPRWGSFWKRRYGALVPPYLVWLALFVAMSFPLVPLSPWLGHYLGALPTGNGHLYYVVLTLELYALAPLFLAVVSWSRQRPWLVAGAAVTWQLVSFGLAGYFAMAAFAPQMLVWTYGGYFVLGGIGATHWPEINQFLAAHRKQILTATALASLAMACVYGLDLAWRHSLAFATNVFQPMTVPYSLAITAVLFAAGTWYSGVRLERKGWDHGVRRLGNASFGIYLVHPIFVHGWLDLIQQLHWSLNPWLNTPVTVVISLAFSLAVVAGIQASPHLTWLVGAPRTSIQDDRRTRSPQTLAS